MIIAKYIIYIILKILKEQISLKNINLSKICNHTIENM